MLFNCCLWAAASFMESTKNTVRKRGTKKEQTDQEGPNKPTENNEVTDSYDNGMKETSQEVVVRDLSSNKNSYFLTRIVILRFQAFLYGSHISFNSKIKEFVSFQVKCLL